MPDYNDEYITTTIHDFKTHISKYIRMLEREECRAVIVKRRNKEVGAFIAFEPRAREVKSGLDPYS